MHIMICPEPFDPWLEIQRFQSEHLELAGKYGATNVFVGTMRDFNDGDVVKSMVLEHYPGMTEKQLQNIIAKARTQWQIQDILLIHRIGEILPNETIVLVAIWTSHRGDAFDASRYIMEYLKSTAPFWKKERLQNNDERWVKCNTMGYAKKPD